MVRVNARLRFLNNMRAHAAMLRFSIDDRVCFQATDGRRVAETLVRYNQKSVSVLADDGGRWTAPPSLLRPFEPRDITPAAGASKRPAPRLK